MRLRRLFDISIWRRSRRRVLEEIDEEFRFHVEERTRDNESEGMEAGLARRDAVRRFGDSRHHRADGLEARLAHVRRESRASFVEGVVGDMRLAVRLAARAPGFTALAVVALALGIGANTAVFSVVEAVLLPELGQADGDRLVQIETAGVELARGRPMPVSSDRFFEYRQGADAFERFVAVQWDPHLMEGMLRPTPTLMASDGLLDLLGIQPMLGRGFSPDVDVRRAPAQLNLEMLITYDFWQTSFGGDSMIVGTQIGFGRSGDRPDPPFTRTIIGVLPPGFRLPDMRLGGALRTSEFSVVLPLSEGWWWRNVRDQWGLHVLAKLDEDSSIEQARAQLEGVAARIAAEYPDEASHAPMVTSLEALPSVLYGRSLMLLWAVVASVLLIACLNVACLALARSVARDGELAVRYSLGGSRRRVLRQLAAESLVIALAGGALGVAVAWAGTGAAVRLFPGTIVGLDDAAIDAPVLGMTLLVSLATVLLFGWAPAVVASRVSLADRLKGIGRGFTSNSMRTFRWMVGVEVALAVALFLGAGLFLNSFLRLTRVELGFNPDQVLAVSVDLPPVQRSKYGGGEGQQALVGLHDRLAAAVAAVPGVEGTSISMGGGSFGLRGLPLVGTGQGLDVTVEDRHMAGSEQGLNAHWGNVSPGYFRLLEIPLLAGRVLEPRDMSSGEAVAVISASAARAFWPDSSPLGKRLTWGQQDLDSQIYDVRYFPHRLFTVVGVVGDVSDRDLGEGAVNQVYSPTALGYGTSNTRSMVVLARTRGRPEEDSAEAIRAAVVGVDEAEIEVTRLEPMRSLLAEVVARPRFNAFMMGWLAVVALALVLSGVYGVLAYTVGRRRRELGLRMALGARPAAVRGLMLREGLVPVAVGMAAGLALLAAFGRFLDAYLYGVELTDPVTLGLTLVLVLVMAAVACYLPARRASAVDPVESLRAE